MSIVIKKQKIDYSFVYCGDYILIDHAKWSFSINKLQRQFIFKDCEFHGISISVFKYPYT